MPTGNKVAKVGRPLGDKSGPQGTKVEVLSRETGIYPMPGNCLATKVEIFQDPMGLQPVRFVGIERGYLGEMFRTFLYPFPPYSLK